MPCPGRTPARLPVRPVRADDDVRRDPLPRRLHIVRRPSSTFAPSRTSSPARAPRRAGTRRGRRRWVIRITAFAPCPTVAVTEADSTRRPPPRPPATGSTGHSAPPASSSRRQRLVPRKATPVGEQHRRAALGEPIARPSSRPARRRPRGHRSASLPQATIPALSEGVPERPKGTGCKPVGSAYGGSNPPAPIRSAPPTPSDVRRPRRRSA